MTAADPVLSQPPVPPVKGGTAATGTLLTVGLVVAWMVGKYVELHPAGQLIASPTDQAMVSSIITTAVGGPLALLAAWWQHKKQALYATLEDDGSSGAT